MSSDREAALQLVSSTRSLLARAQSQQERRYAVHRDVMAQIASELRAVTTLLNQSELDRDSEEATRMRSRIARLLTSISGLHRTIEIGGAEEQDFSAQIDMLQTRLKEWEMRLVRVP